ncbi:general substrate transporter [Aspergillus violaceofuscus CBS 115571]|uniref:General substrate transporter n=1 Tax=Aspergillus violaceofuscus (strain CBS 115571) TaxID=1450538 RepID=A0A2V5HZR8_ASPV1|nr:general substrate transporter [Aspergillus violaceofuscus CBS 115571]
MLERFLRAKEDRPTPPEVYNLRLYFTVMAISMSLLVFGYDTSFIGTTLEIPSFTHDFGLDGMSAAEKSATTGNLTSVFSVGAFFGSVLMFFIFEVFGRRVSLLIADVVAIVGAVLCTAANGHLGVLYTGRVLCGFGVGGFVSVVPIYISELSPPAVRGRMTGLFEAFYQMGSLVGFWINFGIKRHIDTSHSLAWRIPMAMQLIPVGLVALCFPVLQESPTWLLKQGRLVEATKAFAYLHQLPVDHHYILEDVAFVQAQLAVEQTLTTATATPGHVRLLTHLRGAWREGRMKGMRNRFGLVIMMTTFQAWGGAVAVNYYSPIIFRAIGLENTTLWTGVYGVIKSVSAIIYFLCFIETAGRKWPWVISCVGCACCMYYLGAYVELVNAHGLVNAAIMIYGFMWSFGANGLPLIIAAEIFPPSLRSVSGPFAGVFIWLWSFTVTKVNPYMFTGMGPGGCGIYLFFGSMLFCSACFAVFFIPETKGLRIDQMDRLFGAVDGQSHDYYQEAEAVIETEKKCGEVQMLENVV